MISAANRRVARLGPLLALLLLLSGAPPLARADSAGYTSIHDYELSRHRGRFPRHRRLPTADRLKHGRVKAVNRVVYGYYPYWLQDLTTIRWEALTHIAWFSVELDSSGNVTATHGWPDTTTVQTAHDGGVRVDLAFTLFSGAGVLALCQDATARSTAITNMVDAMEAGGADGISVDFEGLVSGTRTPFTTFITELRAELNARGLTTAEISLAGPAVDWNDNFDLPALLDQIDYYFIMGYDYFWSGSGRAGPTGILRVTPDWRVATAWSAVRSIAYYTRQIPANRRHQIIYGVPYYGREWTTTTGDMASTTIANVGSVTYSAAQADLADGQTRRWDPGSRTPWYAWQDSGTWHQVYYDDVESLTFKYQLALDEDLGGVGMWALNHDAPFTELWDLLEDTFGAEPLAPEGSRQNPIRISSFPYDDSRDTTVSPSQYFNNYSCNPDLDEYGREWVYRVDLCQPGILAASVPEYPGNDPDPDVHLLSAPDQDACLARAHTDLSYSVTPGQYLLTVDTYVDDAIEMEGTYDLHVTFTPEPGSEGCASTLVCDSGDCVCPEATQTDCAGACVDLQTDAAHCGDCDHPCDAGETCEAGQCVAGPALDAGAPSADASDASDLPCCGCPDKGCGCQHTDPGVGLPALFLLGLLGLALRRRRSRRPRP